MLYDISGKIDPALIDVLSAVKNVAVRLNIPFFIVGATARDFILEHCHNIKSPVMTQDIDLGAKVPNWEKFNTLSEALLATGNFSKGREKQRYVYKSIYIDIIPFGPIAGKDRKIKWPPEDDIIMSTLGFEEAYQHAITVRLSRNPALDIKIPTIPGLAIMKLISWNEKYPERKKDAKDLLFIMENYEYAGIDSRLYEEEISLLKEEGFDNCLAGIRLLGRDMAKISDSATLNKIREIVSNETVDPTGYRLINNMVSMHDDFDETLFMLEKLKQGVLERR
jgi:predicted nucleotidyltransferase